MKLSSRTSVAPWSLLAYTVADDQTDGADLDQGLLLEISALCAKASAVSIALQVDFKRIPGVFRTHQAATPTRGEWRPVPPEQQPMFLDLRDKLAAARQVEALVAKGAARKDGHDVPGEHDAADAGAVEEFLHFASTRVPARRSLFFMYGHSAGPMGLFYDDDGRDGTPHPLRLTDLARALGTLRSKPDMALFRDCYMSNLEAVFELRGHTPFLLGSQSEIPASGVWPWPAIAQSLQELASTRDAALAVGAAMAEFLAVPRNRWPFSDVPFSVVDVQAARAIDEPLRQLTDVLVASRADDARRGRLARAIDSARRGLNSRGKPGDPALLDMHRLCDALLDLPWQEVRTPARTLRTVLDTVVIQHSAQKDDFHGLGLYCRPVSERHEARSHVQAGSDEDWEQDRAYYAGLSLSRITGWDRIALDPLRP